MLVNSPPFLVENFYKSVAQYFTNLILFHTKEWEKIFYLNLNLNFKLDNLQQWNLTALRGNHVAPHRKYFEYRTTFWTPLALQL